MTPDSAPRLAADPLVARHILFCGDPAVAPSAATAARCAVVTMEPVAATDLTVLVDRLAATLHPIGEVVRPHLQSVEMAAQVAEVIAPLPEWDEGAPEGETGHDVLHRDVLHRDAESGPPRRWPPWRPGWSTCDSSP